MNTWSAIITKKLKFTKSSAKGNTKRPCEYEKASLGKIDCR